MLIAARTNQEDTNMTTRSNGEPKPVRWVAAGLLLVPMLTLSVQAAHAQGAEELAEQQLQIMREYMEAAGMDQSQVDQVEAMVQGKAQQVGAAEAAEKAQAAREFEARTAGLGHANVSIIGKTYQLQVTECDTTLLDGGDFSIGAQYGPDQRDGMLSIRGRSSHKRVELYFSSSDGFWEAYIQDSVAFDGERFEWAGRVDGDWPGKTEGESAHISLRVTCRD